MMGEFLTGFAIGFSGFATVFATFARGFAFLATFAAGTGFVARAFDGGGDFFFSSGFAGLDLAGFLLFFLTMGVVGGAGTKNAKLLRNEGRRPEENSIRARAPSANSGDNGHNRVHYMDEWSPRLQIPWQGPE